MVEYWKAIIRLSGIEKDRVRTRGREREIETVIGRFDWLDSKHHTHLQAFHKCERFGKSDKQ